MENLQVSDQRDIKAADANQTAPTGPNATKRAGWITLPWDGYRWISGDDPDDIRARAERDRQLEIAGLERRIRAVRAMPLVVEYPEDM